MLIFINLKNIFDFVILIYSTNKWSNCFCRNKTQIPSIKLN